MYQGRLGERCVQVRNGRSDEAEGLCDLSVGSGGSDRERRRGLKRGNVAFCIVLAILFVIGAVIIVNDAVNHRGYNFQTRMEYRQMVSEGKR